MGNTTVPMTGVESAAPEILVTAPAEQPILITGAGNPTGIEILHGGSPGEQVTIIIPPQAVVVDLERGATLGGRPIGKETMLDLYNDGRKKAGLKGVTMEQIEGKKPFGIE